MDRSIDNYLHKKFKKQLSIDTKPYQQNDKENKNSLRSLEQSEEKTPTKDHRSSPVKDNNRSTVPNESTNSENHNSRMPVASAPELSKSSISNESGNSKPCISNEHEEIRCRSFSFDTPFRLSETTKLSSSLPTSAIDYPYYGSQNQDSRITPPPPQEDGLSKDEYKNEESATMPEKTPNGKYVCHYCNLVCSKPSVLQKHIRAHTNERPYPCTSCGFSFKTRSNLYKHCRSRTHANRVMGVKAQENSSEIDGKQNYTDNATQTQSYSTNEEGYSERCHKPYKPRFHTVQAIEEDDKSFRGTDLSHHINEIINKNNSIVNSSDPNLLKRRFGEALIDTGNNNEYVSRSPTYTMDSKPDEPLNLTNKNRKRCVSEIAEPVMQKSLIKELLLKNLYSDMHCPYCKMIFQTVTELELHKLRSCKGKPSEAKYTRSSSVNVASILTKNKNAFDNIPQLQNTVFPLNSPGPFLGKTRLVESDKNKSFSFDAVNMPNPITSETSPNFALSPVPFPEERKPHIKLFGGEMKIHDSSGETKSYRFDSKDCKRSSEISYSDFDGKITENRVVKSSLQSGGTILTSKPSKEEPKSRDVIRIYDNISISPSVDGISLGKSHFGFDSHMDDYSRETNQSAQSSLAVPSSDSKKYPNITDFSNNALKLLTPNLKHPSLQISGMLPQGISLYETKVALSSHLTTSKLKHDIDDSRPNSNISVESDQREIRSPCQSIKRSGVIQKNNQVSTGNIYNPMTLLVNGKVVRYVPGIPGPVAADGSLEVMYGSNIVAVGKTPRETLSPMQPPLLAANNPSSRSSPIIVQRAITPIIEKVPPQRQDYVDSKSMIISSKVTELPSPLKFSERQRSPEKPHELKPPGIEISSDPKKFARPNSLPLKPTTASLKQHHGLTPTIFNQILISPDTPRVAKKYAHQLFNGNYFSYLGLKSSTKPVYCTLNKTQPFYVPHFKKLSMYSEWRQQDTKVDKMYVSSYDSRQRNQRFTTAGKTDANLIIHSSYKFVVSELPSKSDKDDENLRSGLVGGYECNEDSPYIRGRGRGRYVCEQCGIRCKKPSMLKKHIRTHSNDRPYACSHCNFSFKTKGNLTKHMKSKAHTKNYTATSSGSGSSTRLSLSQSSDSETDDSGMDSSDESMTRQQEHEAAYGLLSLSQKTSVGASSTEILSPSGIIRTASPASSADQFMTTEEVAYVSKTNYAKNKILDNLKYNLPNKQITDNISPNEDTSKEDKSLATYLGKTGVTRPLTYPYTSALPLPSPVTESKLAPVKEKSEFPPKSIGQFDVIQKYAKNVLEHQNDNVGKNSSNYLPSPVPTLKVNDVEVQELIQERKRKITVIENTYKAKVHKNDEVMDLSITSSEKRESPTISRLIVDRQFAYDQSPTDDFSQVSRIVYYNQPHTEIHRSVEELNYRNVESSRKPLNQPSGSIVLLNPDTSYSQDVEMHSNSSSDTTRQMEYDNSAMETLADVATKQEKLDKNILAKSVASEYLKLATQNENMDCRRDSSNSFIPNKDVMNDLIANSEGNKSCTICSKSFIKPFQLRLHMNIHYLERPFRCDTCSVSFRTKGHLQKHERSASHYSKLSSSPAQSSSEPRPFKCSDCSIAFRIHGHLAKHLRSKLHILKLECLSKIPFGLYAELERSNSLLTEINTSDGDQCLESLKTLAKKVFINDPGKLQTVISEVEAGSHLDPNS